MTVTLKTNTTTLAVPPQLQKSKPALSQPARRLPLGLVSACILASALGAVLVIAADIAVNSAMPGFIPTPRIAARPDPRAIPEIRAPVASNLNAADRQSLYLVRSTLLALDQANRTGNYSVLRALGTPQFRARNSSADLAVIFSSLRRNNIDIAEAALLQPTWQHRAKTGSDGLKLRGVLKLATRKLLFDMQFQPINGNWSIYALTVAAQMPDNKANAAFKRDNRANTNPTSPLSPRGAPAIRSPRPPTRG